MTTRGAALRAHFRGQPLHANSVPGGGLPKLIGELTRLVRKPLTPRPNHAIRPAGRSLLDGEVAFKLSTQDLANLLRDGGS
eukprot:9200069-Alexandrium_andersonii.AAC.1